MPTLQFKGKNIIWNHHLAIPYHTLEEVPELDFSGSKNLENENLLIEGDNLLALKSLLPNYTGKIKCIYIDPPYNTGNDNGTSKSWIYNDNVNSPLLKEWLGKEVGLKDLTRHDKWLCMMTPRLRIIQDLLEEGGVLFISINELELHHLRCLVNEIFGEENFIEIFSWTKTSTPPGLSSKSRQTNEYILCFENHKTNKKYKGELLDGGDQPLLNTGNSVRNLTFPKDIVVLNIPDGKYKAGEFERIRLLETIEVQNGKSNIDIKIEGEFKWTSETLEKEISKGTTFIIKSEKFAIRFIRVDEGGYKAPTNLIKEKLLTPILNKNNFNIGTNETATAELNKLIGENSFPFPKPISLVKFLIQLCTEKDDIVLDSFAGSGTTGHAILDLNNEDGGSRKFILIQMPESTNEEPNKNICNDITRLRLKMAIEKNKYKSGFKYLRVGIPIDAESMLNGNLPSYSQFAKYVFYLCSGKNLIDTKSINPKNYSIGKHGNTDIYLIYEQDYDKLTRLALNLKFAENLRKENPTRKAIVYAPACFLDEEYLEEHQIQFVSIPYNLFQRDN